MLKKAITGAGAVLMAPPAFAQAYSPGDGPGNVIDLPLAEATNGAAALERAPTAWCSKAHRPTPTRRVLGMSIAGMFTGTTRADGRFGGSDH